MIVITGASRGLGRAIAMGMSGEGHRIVGFGRSSVPEIDGVYHVQGDVRNAGDIQRLKKAVVSSGEPLDALINAAGISSMNLAVMTPAEVSREIVEVNLVGTINVCQALVPLMVRQKNGVVLNFSSIAVTIALAGEAVYAASKAGVEVYTRVLAKEVSSFGIRCNCLAPGPIATDLLKGVPAEKIDEVVRRQAIQRQFTPEDVVEAVRWLLDPQSRSMTGIVFPLGGS